MVLNCTGLGANALFDDEELVPGKGQLALLVPQPELDYMYIAGGFYMFPREDGVVLGGSNDNGDWSVEPDPAVTQRIIEGHRHLWQKIRL